MFLTLVQNVMRRQLFKGSMHRGKYRYVRPIKMKDMNLLREEYEREERVMGLLMNPYLSAEESRGHTAVHDKSYKRYLEIKEMRRLKKLKENITLEDRLKHLSFRDVWD
ncbi:ribosomal protein 63, mitochondrial [Contarinia nasturtii]|uniref:ribosomal protein 63, mitochondrial n=1 Tax=Contarinia nasturtii TaxID=265458 RepID=UPI0012D39A05|nr:ribosomal protein 63, mitochondrial [Contarinia nasturtii]